MFASTLLDTHRTTAWVLVYSNALAGAWAIAAQYVPVLRSKVGWALVVVAQLTTFAMGIIGVLIVNRLGVELDQFHALYGFSTILTVGILYSYRGSPFIKDKQYLLYGCGSLFIMGLGLRNINL